MVKTSENRPLDEKRHFFKIMLPGHYTTRLQIPLNFVEHISKEAFTFATLTLEDSSGSHWFVKLSKTTDGTYLEDGWQDFVNDHSIYDYNFLLFGYDGNTCFNVLIFDESACQRDYVFRIKTNQGPVFSNGAKKSDESLETPGFVQKASKDNSGQRLLTFKPNRLKNARREDVELTNEQLSPTISSSSRRRPATEEEKAKVQKAAESFTSEFPYFLRCLTASSVYMGNYMNVPSQFGKTHFHTQRKAKVTIRNTKGEAWRVNLFYNGERTTFCGGWPAFVHANKLEPEDICIFELVGKSEMQVHIFRAVKES